MGESDEDENVDDMLIEISKLMDRNSDVRRILQDAMGVAYMIGTSTRLTDRQKALKLGAEAEKALTQIMAVFREP